MRGLLSMLSLVRNEFDKFNNTGEGMLDPLCLCKQDIIIT